MTSELPLPPQSPAPLHPRDNYRESTQVVCLIPLQQDPMSGLRTSGLKFVALVHPKGSRGSVGEEGFLIQGWLGQVGCNLLTRDHPGKRSELQTKMLHTRFLSHAQGTRLVGHRDCDLRRFSLSYNEKISSEGFSLGHFI